MVAAGRPGAAGPNRLASIGGPWPRRAPVASGFSDVERRRLYALLVKIPRARPQVAHEKQIRDVHWVDPVYTGEVAFREYGPGRGLRHPSWKGLRDTAADTVGMPPAVDSGDGVSATPED